MIHYAKLKNSPRLQRLLEFLEDCKPHTTLEIIGGAKICAVNSAVTELRRNGFDVSCTRNGRIYSYQLGDISK